MIFGFLLEMTIKMGIFYIVMYLTGLLVLRKGVKVNYTRKINHFTLLVVPFLLGFIFGPGGSSTSDMNIVMRVVGLLSGLLFFVIFLKPIRERVSVIRTAFSSIDRPEDRPYTPKKIVYVSFASNNSSFVALVDLDTYEVVHVSEVHYRGWMEQYHRSRYEYWAHERFFAR